MANDIVEERSYKDGIEINPRTGAEIIRDPATGGITEVFKYKDGNIEDGIEINPRTGAEIIRDPATGGITEVFKYKDGNIHREDGPAVIERDAATGVVIREGKQHREDSPPIIERGPLGTPQP